MVINFRKALIPGDSRPSGVTSRLAELPVDYPLGYTVRTGAGLCYRVWCVYT
jgi:hypothetical protein